MVLTKPDGMEEADCVSTAREVRDWFTLLNPYEYKGELFNVEDANKRVKRGEIADELEPLYGLAVSAKRYALFNLDKGGCPVMRKVSAHGLGQLRPRYKEERAPRRFRNPSYPSGIWAGWNAGSTTYGTALCSRPTATHLNRLGTTTC
jgi:hypothetical protein